MNVRKGSYWQLVGRYCLLIFCSRLGSSRDRGLYPYRGVFANQLALWFSTCRDQYLLDLILDGSDVFEGAGDDVVDGVVEGFYFNVDKGVLVLMLVHLGRNNEIGIKSSTKI